MTSMISPGYLARRASSAVSRLVSSKSTFLSSPSVILAGLFSVLVANRYWLSRRMFGPWYFGDESLDSCILPFQLSQGEALWPGGTHYLQFLLRLVVYRLVGAGPEVARMTNILFFAVSVVIFYWAFQRPFGKGVSWFVVVTMLLSSPFITHSIFATSLTYSLLPTAVILWILLRPLSSLSVGLLGCVAVAGLYLYPAAFLTGMCLILFHSIIFRRSWRWTTRLIFLVEFAFFLGLAYRVRILLTEESDWKRWAGGLLSFDGIGQGITVVLKDTFWESTSFNSLNSGAPYLDTFLVGFLLIGLVSSMLYSTPHPPDFERKWILVGLLTFLGSVLLSGLAGLYPGVRRVFSSVPLLILIAGLGAKHLWRWKAFRPCLVVATILCFTGVALRSSAISQKDWPTFRYWSRQPDFMTAAAETLLQSADSRRDVVIIGYPSSAWSGEDYRCALSLDSNLKKHFRRVIVIPRSQLNRRHELQGESILLASENFSEKELQNFFGSRPTSTRIREASESAQPDKLLAIYEFTEPSARHNQR